MKMRITLLMVVAALAVFSAEAKKPLVNVSAIGDVFWATSDFFVDVGTLGHGKAYEQYMALHPTVKEALPPAGKDMLQKAEVHAATASAAAKAHAGAAAAHAQDAYGKLVSHHHSALRAKLEVYISTLVAGFEALVPKQAGAIPKDLPGFCVFLVYMHFVFYVTLKVVKIFYKICKFFLCSVLCRVCCKKKVSKAAAKKATAKGKAAAPAEQKKPKKH